MATVTVNDITTGFKHFTIEGVTFSLKGGDIWALLGRSGSGKSTVLKTLLQQLEPKKGSITFSEESLIGYSPQQNALFNYLSINENLEIFAQLNGVNKKDFLERKQQLLKRLDLKGHEEKLISKLSGGMEKRADLAVTLIHNPDIIILDEPFTGLDVSLQKFIWRILRELAQQGKIIIITSHLLEDVQRYCTVYGLIENHQFYGDTEIRKQLQKHEGSLEVFFETLFVRGKK